MPAGTTYLIGIQGSQYPNPTTPLGSTLVLNNDPTYSIDLAPNANFEQSVTFTLDAQEGYNWPNDVPLWIRITPGQPVGVTGIDTWIQPGGISTAPKNVNVSGEVLTNATAIQSIPVSATPPTLSQGLFYNGSEWVPANTPSVLPSGNAGGDLAGQYPNPTVNGIQGIQLQPPGGGQIMSVTPGVGAAWMGPPIGAGNQGIILWWNGSEWTYFGNALGPGNAGEVATWNGSTWVTQTPSGGSGFPLTSDSEVGGIDFNTGGGFTIILVQYGPPGNLYRINWSIENHSTTAIGVTVQIGFANNVGNNQYNPQGINVTSGGTGTVYQMTGSPAVTGNWVGIPNVVRTSPGSPNINIQMACTPGNGPVYGYATFEQLG
jgi:hypothetical protein